MTDKKWCAGYLYGSRHGGSCFNPAKVERGGKWFCGLHDPEAVTARRAKKEQAQRAKLDAKSRDYANWRTASDERHREATERIARIGIAGAWPATQQGRLGTEYTGGIVLTADAAEVLIESLATARLAVGDLHRDLNATNDKLTEAIQTISMLTGTISLLTSR